MKDYLELYEELDEYKDDELVMAYEICSTLLNKRKKEKEFKDTFLREKGLKDGL